MRRKNAAIPWLGTSSVDLWLLYIRKRSRDARRTPLLLHPSSNASAAAAAATTTNPTNALISSSGEELIRTYITINSDWCHYYHFSEYNCSWKRRKNKIDYFRYFWNKKNKKKSFSSSFFSWIDHDWCHFVVGVDDVPFSVPLSFEV